MKLSVRTITGAALLSACSLSQALSFNFSFTPSTTVAQQQAFVAAGARWSNLLTDSVTLDMTVGVEALGAGILASAGSRTEVYDYSAFNAALNADISSAADALAVSSLPTAPSFGLLINRTIDSPNGANSATAYLDNNGSDNNAHIRMNTANAKALGLDPGTGSVGSCALTCDASITFSSSFSWDYDPSDGITGGAFDFIGVAAHEIGHALGFRSGVDVLDYNPTGILEDQFTHVTPLDLFRYSADSFALGVIDWTASTTSKFFSLDGGATAVAEFSTGLVFGDGQQASHWKDSLGLGILDPTASPGELLAISANDVLALDAIGWNVAAVPEPSTYALFGLGLIGLAARRRVLASHGWARERWRL